MQMCRYTSSSVATTAKPVSTPKKTIVHELEPGLVDAIRQATNGNFPLGDGLCRTDCHGIGQACGAGGAGKLRQTVQPASMDQIDEGLKQKRSLSPDCRCYPQESNDGVTVD